MKCFSLHSSNCIVLCLTLWPYYVFENHSKRRISYNELFGRIARATIVGHSVLSTLLKWT